ncbi:uncharacterized protein TM35_001111000 [Trypanosoma theileri]|uniref:Mucin-associated surface protein (MASP) n=1 Tax=Trypanosoma theileri TaxID=67003 RepID=A0A1X0NDU9_9TRYP|nr:uncharacterized protein TM35_001111000 [Trypanosoma theileri]ORC81594.1 hypothetical protein TM35_001111000 [Trypanosoma theileri]
MKRMLFFLLFLVSGTCVGVVTGEEPSAHADPDGCLNVASGDECSNRKALGTDNDAGCTDSTDTDKCGTNLAKKEAIKPLNGLTADPVLIDNEKAAAGKDKSLLKNKEITKELNPESRPDSVTTSLGDTDERLKGPKHNPNLGQAGGLPTQLTYRVSDSGQALASRSQDTLDSENKGSEDGREMDRPPEPTVNIPEESSGRQGHLKEKETTSALSLNGVSKETSETSHRTGTQEQATSAVSPREAQQNDLNAPNNNANGGTTSTQEGTVHESSSSTSAKPPAKPLPQEEEGTKTSDNANAKNGTSPEGSESTSNQEDDVRNTENSTTTTTTTLPPETVNNKKGDADSSSSISSSVWVRVPLLIVVTLACILMW